MSRSAADRVLVGGIGVDNLSRDEAIEAVAGLLRAGGSYYAAVVNAAKLVLAQREPRLRRILLDAALVTADGMSVVWASRLLGRPLKERVTGIDLFERLVGYAADQSLPVYFLGAQEESVQAVVESFRKRFSKLIVAGYRNGYFEKHQTAQVARAIEASGADLLFVAMGSPAQELWIAENLVRTSVRFAMGVGGSFDHLSGRSRRAPHWMQATGLEWLYRLAREPRRLWRRYLVGNALFVWLVAKQLIKDQ